MSRARASAEIVGDPSVASGSCAEAGGASRARLIGRVVVELSVGDDGRVSGATVDASSVDAPAEIAVTAGRHDATGVDAPQLAWHEVAVEELFVDEGMTQPFTGIIYAQRAEAVAAELTHVKMSPLTSPPRCAGADSDGKWACWWIAWRKPDRNSGR